MLEGLVPRSLVFRTVLDAHIHRVAAFEGCLAYPRETKVFSRERASDRGGALRVLRLRRDRQEERLTVGEIRLEVNGLHRHLWQRVFPGGLK